MSARHLLCRRKLHIKKIASELAGHGALKYLTVFGSLRFLQLQKHIMEGGNLFLLFVNIAGTHTVYAAIVFIETL